MEKGRTLRFDISASIHPHLERHSEDADMGVPDLIRRILRDWVKENPHPDLVS